MTPAAAPPGLLAMTGVSRRFGAVQALDAVHFTVRPGTVHALLGENGAGKSTLMRVAVGLVAPDAGSLTWHGRPVRVRSPAEARALGIGMVHQHFTLVPAMTVAENVALGGSGRFRHDEAARQVRDVSERVGLSVDPSALVESLPVGAQQRCEIVKALARRVELLILDEPTAVLAPTEARDLLAWVRRFVTQGAAVVLITHKLRDALAVADDVTVLHRGRTVLQAPAAECTEARLAAAMLGGDASAMSGASAIPAAAGGVAIAAGAASPSPVLIADRVSVRDARGVVVVEDATVQVHGGEIVGLAAVEGAGHHELLRVLAGRRQVDAGTVRVPETVGFVPEDRHRDALLLDGSLVENLALRDAGRRRGRIDWRALAARTASVVAAHDVRTAGVNTPARALSGGNQQKLVVGRELLDRPAALVVENPTRGLDFVSTAAVHAALRAARDAGAAVVVYSSDLDEVLALADRVLVMHAGRVQAVSGDREQVGRAMLGAAHS